jgi:hypothetical protein
MDPLSADGKQGGDFGIDSNLHGEIRDLYIIGQHGFSIGFNGYPNQKNKIF